uniref:Outer membrane protein n=1 Tax=Klebsiella pneumoniae TaxID=573 RepID=A0A6G9HWM7_KLEPN|nr:hypothetical protein [Klebsiella pneumoniae]QIQ15157.1 Outer membrane protein [Klebsiella pneumoniae]
MIINQKILETDITNIINAFERLMDESNRSIIPVKSRHVDGLSLFENMYIRARSKHASLLGKPVLVVSSVSVFITNQGCFSTLLSHFLSGSPGHGLGYKEILDQQGNFLLTVEMRDQLQNVLDANMMLADKLNYSGTPVFIVMNMKNPQNKTTTIMPGAPDFYRLQQAINKAKGN